MRLEDILLILAGTLTAMIAGLFFGFAVAVNGGLHRLKDSEYVAAMQSINAAILNPIFLFTFGAPVLLLPLVTFLHQDGSTLGFPLLIGASILYIFGTFGLTIAGNVPLNRKLERFSFDDASQEAISNVRKSFEVPWNRLHTIRTVASIVATILIFAACLCIGDKGVP